MRRALAASVVLIDSTLRAVADSERCASRRPIRTSRKLHRASGKLREAAMRLERAVRSLSETAHCAGREPQDAAGVPQLLVAATARWFEIAVRLEGVSGHLTSVHENLLDGLVSGRLVPERDDADANRRARIVLVPRAMPPRMFLLWRRSSARDRIASIPQQRRRTACPAPIDAPRRIFRGRAPPVVSTCLL